MSDTPIHDAPDLSLVVPEDDAWRRDQRAFAEMLPSLLAMHRDQYVAVHDGEVVASGPTLVEVALEAYGRVGYVPVYVDLVTDRPRELVRIPSPRLARVRTPIGPGTGIKERWGSLSSADVTIVKDRGASAK
jgi:hypothetical protein